MGISNHVQQLLNDDSFVEWVLRPTDTSDIHWNDYKKRDEDTHLAVNEARQLVYAIYQHEAKELPDNINTDEIWQRITSSIHQQTERVITLKPHRRMFWWWAAASLIFVAALGGYLYQRTSSNSMSLIASVPLIPGSILRENNSKDILTILLADGSKVFLYPGARLHHPTIFNKAQREVYLTGEAFFDISKDPQHPFIVHTGKVFTKVLGTSFLIKAMPGGTNVTVVVRTGKVAVARESNGHDLTYKEVMLLPDQQAVIETKDLKREPVVAPVSAPIREPVLPSYSFEFEDAPVAMLLDSISKIYQVKVLYDTKKLAACRVTTSLSDEPLETKVRIICSTINATYRFTDSSVVIQSPGCR